MDKVGHALWNKKIVNLSSSKRQVSSFNLIANKKNEKERRGGRERPSPTGGDR